MRLDMARPSDSAQCWAGDRLDGEIEIGAHVAEDGLLLEILLAEEEVRGLGDEEQFGDDGADAAEMAGPAADGRSLEEVGHWARVDGGHERILAGGIGHIAARRIRCDIFRRGVHFCRVWDEDRIAAGGFEQCEVLFERARVFGEIFEGTELSRIDED